MADENRSVEGRFGVAPFVAGAFRNGLVDDCVISVFGMVEFGMTGV